MSMQYIAEESPTTFALAKTFHRSYSHHQWGKRNWRAYREIGPQWFGECANAQNCFPNNHHHTIFLNDLLKLSQNVPIISRLKSWLWSQGLELKKGVPPFSPLFGCKAIPEVLVETRQNFCWLRILISHIFSILYIGEALIDNLFCHVELEIFVWKTFDSTQNSS